MSSVERQPFLPSPKDYAIPLHIDQPNGQEKFAENESRRRRGFTLSIWMSAAHATSARDRGVI